MNLQSLLTAIIEIPSGTTHKMEINKSTGELRCDRELKVPCPADYGFIENTLAEDGDALDVFVIGTQSKGLDALYVEPVAVFMCTDQGVNDHKIIAVPVNMELTTDFLMSTILEIETYLSTYKTGFEIQDYSEEPVEIWEIIRRSLRS